MNYVEWIRTVGLAVNLLIKTEFDSSVSVQQEWRRPLPSDFFSNDSVSAIFLEFQSKEDSGRLTGIYLIPWDNLFSPGSGTGELILPRYKLLTVTRYAIIYEDLGTEPLSNANEELYERLFSRLKDLFDYGENQREISSLDGVTTPEMVQIISQTEYKYYIEQDVAQPGSKSPLRFNYDSMPENKMILGRLIPETGPIKSQWIFPARTPESVCAGAADSLVRKVLDDQIGSLLKTDMADMYDACRKATDAIVKILDEQGCDNEDEKDYYTRLVRKFLLCKDQVITEIPFDNIFGDYQPKTTPDVLSDYIPGVYEKIKALPAAELQNIPGLLAEYRKYRQNVSRDRGKWVEGNDILGARPQEYQPSESEIMLCETGSRIKEIADNNSASSIREVLRGHSRLPKKIKFRKFEVIHMDVMGSGRFFYISNIEEIQFKLY